MRNSRPVEPGINEFHDGSVLVQRGNLAFADRAAFDEWREKNL